MTAAIGIPSTGRTFTGVSNHTLSRANEAIRTHGDVIVAVQDFKNWFTVKIDDIIQKLGYKSIFNHRNQAKGEFGAAYTAMLFDVLHGNNTPQHFYVINDKGEAHHYTLYPVTIEGRAEKSIALVEQVKKVINGKTIIEEKSLDIMLPEDLVGLNKIKETQITTDSLPTNTADPSCFFDSPSCLLLLACQKLSDSDREKEAHAIDCITQLFNNSSTGLPNDIAPLKETYGEFTIAYCLAHILRHSSHFTLPLVMMAAKEILKNQSLYAQTLIDSAFDCVKTLLPRNLTLFSTPNQIQDIGKIKSYCKAMAEIIQECIFNHALSGSFAETYQHAVSLYGQNMVDTCALHVLRSPGHIKKSLEKNVAHFIFNNPSSFTYEHHVATWKYIVTTKPLMFDKASLFKAAKYIFSDEKILQEPWMMSAIKNLTTQHKIKEVWLPKKAISPILESLCSQKYTPDEMATAQFIQFVWKKNQALLTDSSPQLHNFISVVNKLLPTYGQHNSTFFLADVVFKMPEKFSENCLRQTATRIIENQIKDTYGEAYGIMYAFDYFKKHPEFQKELPERIQHIINIQNQEHAQPADIKAAAEAIIKNEEQFPTFAVKAAVAYVKKVLLEKTEPILSPELHARCVLAHPYEFSVHEREQACDYVSQHLEAFKAYPEILANAAMIVINKHRDFFEAPLGGKEKQTAFLKLYKDRKKIAEVSHYSMGLSDAFMLSTSTISVKREVLKNTKYIVYSWQQARTSSKSKDTFISLKEKDTASSNITLAEEIGETIHPYDVWAKQGKFEIALRAAPQAAEFILKHARHPAIATYHASRQALIRPFLTV